MSSGRRQSSSKRSGLVMSVSCRGRGMVFQVHTNLDFKAMLLLVYLLDPLADGSILKKDISLEQDLV